MWEQFKKFQYLIGFGLFIFIIFLGALVLDKGFDIRSKIDVGDFSRTLTVEGKGEMVVRPDIAQISIGVVTDNVSAVEAQRENAALSNAINEFLKSEGVADKDIKTIEYAVYPRYDYRENAPNPNIIGYEVRQTFEVKIRNLEKAGDIINGVGERGANSVGQLMFTVDDPDEFEAQATELAIQDAKMKARDLSKQLGVSLGRIVSFSKYGGGQPPIIYGREFGGFGGDMAVPAPKIEPGENKIIMSVSITFEMR